MRPIACLLLFFALGTPLFTHAQGAPFFVQPLNASAYQGQHYTLELMVWADSASNAASFDVMANGFSADSRTLKSRQSKQVAAGGLLPNAWNKITLSGQLGNGAALLYVGVSVSGQGIFYFDDFTLTINGQELLQNRGFEDTARIKRSVWFANWLAPQDKAGFNDKHAHEGRWSYCMNRAASHNYAVGNNDTAGHFIRLPNVRIYYETYGSGAPLLLLHGANETIASFSNQVPALSKHYQVIAMETRGHGHSSVDTTRLTYELYANDVNALLDSLHLQQVNLLGWSDGGNTGLILAMQHPEKIRKLAVMGAVLYNDSTSVFAWVNDTLRARNAEMRQQDPGSFKLRVNECLLTEPHIKPASLAAIRCPVLVMAGEHDAVLEQHTRLIAGSIPQSRVLIFKKASHEAPAEYPDKFNKAVLQFFAD